MNSVSLYIVIIALFTLGYKCKYNGHILAINNIVANKNNKNVCERVRFSKARTVYYANTTATLRLILSGDIEPNPCPAECPCCNKGFSSNSKQLVCSVCHVSTLYTWGNVNWNKKPSAVQTVWTCPTCIHVNLPFHNMRSLAVLDLSDPNFSVTLGSEPHLEGLNKYLNNTSIAHMNVQSLRSTFYEFSYMHNQYYFDIVALSETWLTGNKHQLDYVQIVGYKSLFNDRKHKRGGGVGFYVKENISFTERKDLSNIEKSIESLWIEVRGRNKNTPYLVGVIYQPNFKSDKQDWLEKFGHLLTEI